MGFFFHKNKAVERSLAECDGNHYSNDVLAANIAKTVIFNNGLVTPDFLADITSMGVHPTDFSFLRKRVGEHIIDILYNNPHISVDNVVVDRLVNELLSHVIVSGKATKGEFLSIRDCPDDRGRWYLVDGKKRVQCTYRNAGEDPKLPQGSVITPCSGIYNNKNRRGVVSSGRKI